MCGFLENHLSFHFTPEGRRFLRNGLLNDITFTEQTLLREHWDPSFDNNFCQDLCGIAQNCYNLSFIVTGRALSQHQVLSEYTQCQNTPPCLFFYCLTVVETSRKTESDKETAVMVDLC